MRTTTLLLLVLLRVCMSMNSQPKCNQCKHFIQPMMKDDTYIGDYFGKCNKFMQIDDSNELKYRYALQARSFEYFCGKKGRLFEQKTNDTNYDIII
jgi:predicted aldo/keto reductase-like oxidoreductase